MFYTEVIW